MARVDSATTWHEQRLHKRAVGMVGTVGGYYCSNLGLILYSNREARTRIILHGLPALRVRLDG